VPRPGNFEREETEGAGTRLPPFRSVPPAYGVGAGAPGAPGAPGVPSAPAGPGAPGAGTGTATAGPGTGTGTAVAGSAPGAGLF
jgi:hypothetical protein